MNGVTPKVESRDGFAKVWAEQSRLNEDQRKFIESIPAGKTASRRYVLRWITTILNFQAAMNGEVLGSHLKAIRKLEARVDALEAREAKSFADAYRGSWQPNNRYAKGSLATHAGSLWLALDDAAGKPGTSTAWRLIVKAGRDA